MLWSLNYLIEWWLVLMHHPLVRLAGSIGLSWPVWLGRHRWLRVRMGFNRLFWCFQVQSCSWSRTLSDKNTLRIVWPQSWHILYSIVPNRQAFIIYDLWILLSQFEVIIGWAWPWRRRPASMLSLLHRLETNAFVEIDRRFSHFWLKANRLYSII